MITTSQTNSTDLIVASQALSYVTPPESAPSSSQLSWEMNPTSLALISKNLDKTKFENEFDFSCYVLGLIPFMKSLLMEEITFKKFEQERKIQWHKLSRFYHSDRNNTPNITQQFINNANDVLKSDKAKTTFELITYFRDEESDWPDFDKMYTQLQENCDPNTTDYSSESSTEQGETKQGHDHDRQDILHRITTFKNHQLYPAPQYKRIETHVIEGDNGDDFAGVGDTNTEDHDFFKATPALLKACALHCYYLVLNEEVENRRDGISGFNHYNLSENRSHKLEETDLTSAHFPACCWLERIITQIHDTCSSTNNSADSTVLANTLIIYLLRSLIHEDQQVYLEKLNLIKLRLYYHLNIKQYSTLSLYIDQFINSHYDDTFERNMGENDFYHEFQIDINNDHQDLFNLEDPQYFSRLESELLASSANKHLSNTTWSTGKKIGLGIASFVFLPLAVPCWVHYLTPRLPQLTGSRPSFLQQVGQGIKTSFRFAFSLALFPIALPYAAYLHHQNKKNRNVIKKIANKEHLTESDLKRLKYTPFSLHADGLQSRIANRESSASRDPSQREENNADNDTRPISVSSSHGSTASSGAASNTPQETKNSIASSVYHEPPGISEAGSSPSTLEDLHQQFEHSMTTAVPPQNAHENSATGLSITPTISAPHEPNLDHRPERINNEASALLHSYNNTSGSEARSSSLSSSSNSDTASNDARDNIDSTRIRSGSLSSTSSGLSSPIDVPLETSINDNHTRLDEQSETASLVHAPIHDHSESSSNASTVSQHLMSDVASESKEENQSELAYSNNRLSSDPLTASTSLSSHLLNATTQSNRAASPTLNISVQDSRSRSLSSEYISPPENSAAAPLPEGPTVTQQSLAETTETKTTNRHGSDSSLEPAPSTHSRPGENAVTPPPFTGNVAHAREAGQSIETQSLRSLRSRQASEPPVYTNASSVLNNIQEDSSQMDLDTAAQPEEKTGFGTQIHSHNTLKRRTLQRRNNESSGASTVSSARQSNLPHPISSSTPASNNGGVSPTIPLTIAQTPTLFSTRTPTEPRPLPTLLDSLSTTIEHFMAGVDHPLVSNITCVVLFIGWSLYSQVQSQAEDNDSSGFTPPQ